MPYEEASMAIHIGICFVVFIESRRRKPRSHRCGAAFTKVIRRRRIFKIRTSPRRIRKEKPQKSKRACCFVINAFLSPSMEEAIVWSLVMSFCVLPILSQKGRSIPQTTNTFRSIKSGISCSPRPTPIYPESPINTAEPIWRTKRVWVIK